MSDDEKPEKNDSEKENFPNTVPIDFAKLAEINSTALFALKDIYADIPNFVTSLNIPELNLSPKLEELGNSILDIQLPTFDANFLTTLPEPKPFIDSLRSESQLIEQQNKAIELLQELLGVVKKHNRSQETILKNVFKMIRELKEEQRIEHPFVDKLYQMALEWGLFLYDCKNR